MIIGFFDVPRSTELTHIKGSAITIAVRVQLDEVVGRDAEGAQPEIVGRVFGDLPNEQISNSIGKVFKDGVGVDPALLPKPHRYRGGRQGDGMMIGAPQEHAIQMLRSVMRMQEEKPWQHQNRPGLPDWVAPMYVALGVCRVIWDGAPYEPGSIPNGDDINILGKLIKREGPGTIILNAALITHIRQHANELVHLIEEKNCQLEGIQGDIQYGRIPARDFPVRARAANRWHTFMRSPWAYAFAGAGTVAWIIVGIRWFWR